LAIFDQNNEKILGKCTLLVYIQLFYPFWRKRLPIPIWNVFGKKALIWRIIKENFSQIHQISQMNCTITSNKLWFSLTMLLLTPSFQRQMFFGSITLKMQISCNQINWKLRYLNTFNDTQEKPTHVIQHVKLFDKKLKLILMDPWEVTPCIF
jgi:hypothetical protein